MTCASCERLKFKSQLFPSGAAIVWPNWLLTESVHRHCGRGRCAGLVWLCGQSSSNQLGSKPDLLEWQCLSYSLGFRPFGGFASCSLALLALWPKLPKNHGFGIVGLVQACLTDLLDLVMLPDVQGIVSSSFASLGSKSAWIPLRRMNGWAKILAFSHVKTLSRWKHSFPRSSTQS